jgi:cell division septal protein FtsQ
MSAQTEKESPAAKSTLDKLLVNQLLWMLFLRVVLYTLILGVSAYLQSGKFNVIVLPPTHLFIFIINLTQ